jgi:hypothetical protein
MAKAFFALTADCDRWKWEKGISMLRQIILTSSTIIHLTGEAALRGSRFAASAKIAGRLPAQVFRTLIAKP